MFHKKNSSSKLIAVNYLIIAAIGTRDDDGGHLLLLAGVAHQEVGKCACHIDHWCFSRFDFFRWILEHFTKLINSVQTFRTPHL